MRQQLEQLKTELREFIELSKTITPGPWKATKSHNHVQGEEPTYDVVGPHSDWFFLELEQDATFIARSRNISPAMAECLLGAVEALERVSETRELVEHGDDNGNGPYVSRFKTSHAQFAEGKLQQILNIWEASK